MTNVSPWIIHTLTLPSLPASTVPCIALSHFESPTKQHYISYGYKLGPNMMGIQVGYNKNYHIKCIEYYEKFDSL